MGSSVIKKWLRRLWGRFEEAPSAPLPVERRLPRFVLHPGMVKSRTDGDMHFVGIGQLASLYRVPLTECVVATEFRLRLFTPAELERMVHLYPREDGDYSVLH
jgi:hypothetical protein